MAFFVGTLKVNLGEFPVNQQVCIIAKNSSQASSLLDECAANYADNGVHEGSSWVFQDELSVEARMVYPISKVTFDEMSQVLPIYCRPQDPEGNLAEESLAEQARTLALRLGEHLKRHGESVSHNRLLHAVAASLGETDWHVLLSKSGKSADDADELESLLATATTALRDLYMGYAPGDIAGHTGVDGLGGLMRELVTTLRARGIDDEGAWDCDLTEELAQGESESAKGEATSPVTLSEGLILTIVKAVERDCGWEPFPFRAVLRTLIKDRASDLGFELSDEQIEAIANRVEP
jgi:hypothetical protein